MAYRIGAETRRNDDAQEAFLEPGEDDVLFVGGGAVGSLSMAVACNDPLVIAQASVGFFGNPTYEWLQGCAHDRLPSDWKQLVDEKIPALFAPPDCSSEEDLAAWKRALGVEVDEVEEK